MVWCHAFRPGARKGYYPGEYLLSWGLLRHVCFVCSHSSFNVKGNPDICCRTWIVWMSTDKRTFRASPKIQDQQVCLVLNMQCNNAHPAGWRDPAPQWHHLQGESNDHLCSASARACWYQSRWEACTCTAGQSVLHMMAGCRWSSGLVGSACSK